jgi:hypothetical protein
MHSTPAARAEIPTSSVDPENPITQIAKTGSNQLALETPANRAGACSCVWERGRKGGADRCAGQSTCCRRWTRSRTGRARARCGP